MDVIGLERVPNQELSVRLADRRFVLRIKEAAGVMVADVTVDGEVVLLASRIVAGTPLIPYRYLEAGNLLLLTDDGQLPDWSQFGLTQTLVYLSAAEIAAL
jgi:hypothetical protein